MFILLNNNVFVNCIFTLNDDENSNIIECTIKVAQQMKLNQSYTDLMLINTNEQMTKALHDKLQGFRFVSRTPAMYDYRHSDACIIISKNYFQLEETIKNIILELYWNPRGKFIIIIENMPEKLQKIADLLIRNNMFNTTIIGKVAENFVVFAYDTELDSCNRPQKLEFVCNCIAYDNRRNTFRFQTPSSMKNCHVKFITANAKPYINFNEPDQIGVDQYMLDIIHQLEGITIELVKFPIPGKHGKFIDANLSYVGMLGEIQAYNVEGAIGAFTLLDSRRRLLEYTFPHLYDRVRFFTTRADSLKMWQAVYVQLSLITKLLILLFFIIFWMAVVKLAIFSKKRDIIKDGLIVYGFFLNNLYVNNMNTGAPHRIIVLSMAIFVMWISCTIQASLLSQQTYPIRGHQVLDPDEIKANFEPILLLLYAFTPTMEQWARACEALPECFKEIMEDKGKNKYTIASDFQTENFRWLLVDDEDNLRVYKSSAVIGIITSTVLFRRGSLLTSVFSKIISPVVRAGLLEHHLSNLAYTLHFKRTYHDLETQVAYNLNDLDEAFIPLVVGHCISLLTFICEMLYKKIFRKNTE